MLIVCCQHGEVWLYKRRRIYLLCCLVMYSELVACWGTTPHQTTLKEHSSSGEDNSRKLVTLHMEYYDRTGMITTNDFKLDRSILGFSAQNIIKRTTQYNTLYEQFQNPIEHS